MTITPNGWSWFLMAMRCAAMEVNSLAEILYLGLQIREP